MFRREMFKTFGERERVGSNNPTDTLQLFSSTPPPTMDCSIHSLFPPPSLSLSPTSLFWNKKGRTIKFSRRLDYFQTNDFLPSKLFFLILWISDCRRPLFSPSLMTFTSSNFAENYTVNSG